MWLIRNGVTLIVGIIAVCFVSAGFTSAKYWLALIPIFAGYFGLHYFLIEDRKKALVRAIKSGDAALLSTLLSSKLISFLLNPEANTNMLNALLIEACDGGSKAVVEVLLERGADVNGRNQHGDTPLIGASGLGSPEVVKLLLDRGADPNGTESHGVSPLMMASMRGSCEVAKLLLDRGADPNATDPTGLTALRKAIMNKRTDVVELLQPLTKVAEERLVMTVSESTR